MIPKKDEQVEAFGNELNRLIDHFRDEFDLSYAAAIGALHYRIYCLERECYEEEEDDDI